MDCFVPYIGRLGKLGLAYRTAYVFNMLFK